MALELEKEIMQQIGLSNHYMWFNGSGSCGGIRREAAKRLPEAIRKQHVIDASSMAEPDADLIALVRSAAEYGDEDNYVLTMTWQVASDVIRAHMDEVGNPEAFARRKAFTIGYWKPKIRKATRENYFGVLPYGWWTGTEDE